jgi:hypothetical protein
MKLVELKHDPIASMQSLLDRLVREGAAHAGLVVTYPDGRQVTLRACLDQNIELRCLP